MRILHVIGSIDPAYGGPPMVAVRLAAGQAILGHEVVLIAYRSDAGEAYVAETRETVPGCDKVDVHFVAPPSGLGQLLARRAGRRVTELLPGSGVVHIHTVWQPIMVAAAVAARRFDVPYVICPHGTLDPWSLRQRRIKKQLALALRYRTVLDHAAFLHVLNADEQRLIEPLGLGCPSVVIPNGVFFEEIEPLPPAGTFRAAHPEIGDAPIVLFLSRLHFKKGLDYLAPAFAHLAERHADAQLVVAGPDGGALTPFREQVETLGLSGRVHVVGPLYGVDKYAALVDADCFCLPSRQEGFSVAITEALACGLPVVITEGCHFPEVAEAGAGEVVCLDAEKVGAALDRVMNDAEGRRVMGERGRDLIRTGFTWTRIAERAVEAYAAVPSTQGA